uniref:Uncharacterized protein n=1 Tax=Anopheles culicifacies TaxID=139723 RepID=A0A182LUL6_9DIPT
MVLSVMMVQTLTTLLEPPPAIGGTKGLSPTGQPHQPQANIAVFMFLFMLCAAEVVFIKLLALTSFGSGDVLTAPVTPQTPTTSTSTQTTSVVNDQPTVRLRSSSPTDQQ